MKKPALVFTICFLLAGCFDPDPAPTPLPGTCYINDQCPAGQVCLDAKCSVVCNSQDGCAEGEVCFDNVCRLPVPGTAPAIDGVAGNSPAGPSLIEDGIVVTGSTLSDAIFELRSAGRVVPLEARERAQTYARLALPSTVRAGEYTLVATNQSGSDTEPVTLVLPTYTSDELIDAVNAGPTKKLVLDVMPDQLVTETELAGVTTQLGLSTSMPMFAELFTPARALVPEGVSPALRDSVVLARLSAADVLAYFDGSGAGLDGTPYQGWGICNGNNGLPDLRGRFPRLAAAAGAIGGSDSSEHTHSINHTHGSFTASGTALTVAQLPAHGHTIDHDHSSYTTATEGAHDHSVPYAAADAAGTECFRLTATTCGAGILGTVTGAHAHVVDLPALTGNSGQAGSGSTHSHTVDITSYTGASGSASATDNRPAFYELVAIAPLGTAVQPHFYYGHAVMPDAETTGLSGVMRLPKNYRAGTDIQLYIEWMAADGSTAPIAFDFRHGVGNLGAPVVFASASQKVVVTPGVANAAVQTTLADIDGAGLTKDSSILFTIGRNGSALNDTYLGAVRLAGVGVRYQVEGVGSPE